MVAVSSISGSSTSSSPSLIGAAPSEPPTADAPKYTLVQDPGALVTVKGILGGLPTNRARLVQAATELGFDVEKLPRPTSGKVALNQAVSSLDDSKLRRKHSKVKGAGGGWAVVQEVLEDGTGVPIGYANNITLVVKVIGPGTDSAERPASECSLIFKNVNEFNQHLKPLIETAYAEFAGAIEKTEINAWAVDYLRTECHAISPNDGFYFVPTGYISRATLLQRLLDYNTIDGQRVSGNSVFMIEVQNGPQALRTLIHAVTEEAERAARNFQVELDKISSESEEALGKRGIKSQLGKIDELGQKLEEYETLIGGALPEIHARMRTMKKQFVQGLVSLDGDKEE